jgi:hypothetical protein
MIKDEQFDQATNQYKHNDYSLIIDKHMLNAVNT